MRRLLPALLAAAAVALAGCDPRGPSPEERANYERVRDAALGEKPERALDALRSFAAATRSPHLKAEAELEIARLLAAEARRDAALAALRELPQVARALPAAEFATLARAEVTQVPEGAWRDEVAAAAEAAIAQAEARRAQERAADARVARQLLEQGEFAGALQHLRGIEAARARADRDDVHALLAEIEERAAAAADALLAETAALPAQAAAERIVEELPRFAGTGAAARLLARGP